MMLGHTAHAQRKIDYGGPVDLAAIYHGSPALNMSNSSSDWSPMVSCPSPSLLDRTRSWRDHVPVKSNSSSDSSAFAQDLSSNWTLESLQQRYGRTQLPLLIQHHVVNTITRVRHPRTDLRLIAQILALHSTPTPRPRPRKT